MIPNTTRLAAMFTALLSACSGRDIPGDESSTTDTTTGDTSSTSSEPTTSDGQTTTATSPETSTTTTTTTTTSDPSSTSTAPPDPSFDSSESECVYDEHLIHLTAEQYQQWLDGEATDTDTDSDSTGTTTAPPDATTSEGDATTSADDGWSFELCVEICDALTAAETWNITSCEKLGVDPEGAVTIECVEIVEHCDGRSHACITSQGRTADTDPVAAHLARAAHDEAASVHAFAALHAELTALAAPQDLLTRIQLAAADEVRHAAAVSALAGNHGAACRRPTRTEISPRTPLEIATENAVEGCVRETWAALLAAHQATWAVDPDIRRVMHTIAADEARHAELAWALDAWLRTLLTADERTAVESARTAAALAVIASVTTTTPAPALVHTAGLPDRPRATRLVHSLAAALWPAAA